MVRWKTFDPLIRLRAPSRCHELFTALACATLLVATACGGDDSNDPPRKPDSGYGTSQPLPAARTCSDLCARVADCAEHLCNEDSHSMRYTGLGDFLDETCESACTDSLVNSNITASEWQCLFQDSCRQVFDYDTCRTQSSYSCN